MLLFPEFLLTGIYSLPAVLIVDNFDLFPEPRILARTTDRLLEPGADGSIETETVPVSTGTGVGIDGTVCVTGRVFSLGRKKTNPKHITAANSATYATIDVFILI